MLEANGLLPPGIHVVSIDEFRAGFVDAFPDSTTRSVLFGRWLQHRAAVTEITAIQRQWIDGSYVTNKVNPGDIDAITFLSVDEIDKLPISKQMVLEGLLSGHATRDSWGIDSFFAPHVNEGDPRSADAKAIADDWLNFFSQVRGSDSLRKGILEVRDDR